MSARCRSHRPRVWATTGFTLGKDPHEVIQRLRDEKLSFHFHEADGSQRTLFVAWVAHSAVDWVWDKSGNQQDLHDSLTLPSARRA